MSITMFQLFRKSANGQLHIKFLCFLLDDLLVLLVTCKNYMFIFHKHECDICQKTNRGLLHHSTQVRESGAKAQCMCLLKLSLTHGIIFNSRQVFLITDFRGLLIAARILGWGGSVSTVGWSPVPRRMTFLCASLNKQPPENIFLN